MNEQIPVIVTLIAKILHLHFPSYWGILENKKGPGTNFQATFLNRVFIYLFSCFTLLNMLPGYMNIKCYIYWPNFITRLWLLSKLNAFFISNTFTRTPDWNWQNIQKTLSNTLRLNVWHSHSSSRYQSKKIIGHTLKISKRTSVSAFMRLYD